MIICGFFDLQHFSQFCDFYSNLAPNLHSNSLPFLRGSDLNCKIKKYQDSVTDSLYEIARIDEKYDKETIRKIELGEKELYKEQLQIEVLF